MTADLRVFPDSDRMSLAVAAEVAATLDAAVRAAGQASLVLSGGRTPRQLYEILATRHREAIAWGQVQVFWADERYVPHDDEASNYRMAAATLLDRVPCPRANVHPMPTDRAEPDQAARDYETVLTRHFAGARPRFDLVLLGMGDDGHTASLFPGAAALDERSRWAIGATAPVEPRQRLTLTVPALAGAARTFFLVGGAGKAEALARVVAAGAGPTSDPAAVVARASSAVTWFADRAAAARLAR